MEENYKRILTSDRVLTNEELTELGVTSINEDRYLFDAALHTTRVAADSGGNIDEDGLDEALIPIRDPEPSLLWTASGGWKLSKDYSVYPLDGSGDFTYSGGGNAVSQRPDGLWQVGWPANTPRNSYTNGVLGRLVEPQRTNQCSRSNTFFSSGATVTCLQNIEGIGGQANTGWKVQRSGSIAYIQNGISTPVFFIPQNATGCVLNYYIKFIDVNSTVTFSPNASINWATNAWNASFNLTANSITRVNQINCSTEIIETLPNGWYRIQIFINTASANGLQDRPLINCGDNQSFGIANADWILGVTNSTSHIVSDSGTISTRNAELYLTNTITNLINSIISNGLTMYAEIDKMPATGFMFIFGIGNNAVGGGAKGIGILYNQTLTRLQVELHGDNGGRQIKTSSLIRAAGKNKLIIRYNPTGLLDFFLNGAKSTHDATVTAVTGITADNKVRFPALLNDANSIFTFEKYYHFLSPLSDVECINRTTP